MNEPNELTLLRALQFAARAHRTQTRKGTDKTPYINHLIDVTTILAECGVTDISILTAAVLHDTIEDQAIAHEELAEKFGRTVADLVAEVSDDKRLDKAVRKQLQIEHAPHLSPAAKQIKNADKISNISDVAHAPAIGWSIDRRREYLAWAAQVVGGLRGINRELDDRFARTLAECRDCLDAEAQDG